MTHGMRYSLIVFSGQVCPHSDHTTAVRDGAAMRTMYPEEEGSYHCDGCGASAAALKYADMHHCTSGCRYALCAGCASKMLNADGVHKPLVDQ